jgi:hypothetical protein
VVVEGNQGRQCQCWQFMLLRLCAHVDVTVHACFVFMIAVLWLCVVQHEVH